MTAALLFYRLSIKQETFYFVFRHSSLHSKRVSEDATIITENPTEET